MKVPEELSYTKEHEWIRATDNEATIGITDFAQSQLGDIIFLELPEIGDKVLAGEPFGDIEAVKTVSELYSPVNGVVTKRFKTSEKINTKPECLKSFKKTVHNARESDFDITMGGFELINHISSVQDFYNDEEVVSIYYDEMASYVKEKVGADTVQIFSHITRNEAQAETGERKGGHRLVHNDFTTRFGATLDPFLKETGISPKRIVVYNLWRRYDKDGVDTPFAVCDKR